MTSWAQVIDSLSLDDSIVNTRHRDYDLINRALKHNELLETLTTFKNILSKSLKEKVATTLSHCVPETDLSVCLSHMLQWLQDITRMSHGLSAIGRWHRTK